MLAKPASSYLPYVLVACMTAALLGWILSLVPGLPGIDGYFHMRFSQEIWKNGIPDNFSHLVYTIYSSDFADDHFLFHILQIPFTFGNLIAGAKIYGVTLGTVAILLFFFILKQHHIRFATLWTLVLLASSAPFLFRLCMARAPSLSLCLLLLATYLVLNKKDRWLLPTAALYVWSYGGFPLIAALASSAFLSAALEGKFRPQVIVYCGIGIVIGLVCHPYFPNNVVFLFKSYTQIEFADVVTAGNEDYPYASSSVVRNALIPWALMLGTVTYFLLRPKTLTSPARTLFIFSTILLCMYMNVRRFVEYWPVFAVMFSAFAFNPFLLRYHFTKHKATHLGKLTLATLWLIFFLLSKDTLEHVRAYRLQDRNPITYSGAATYLKTHTPKDAIVFTGDWDDFPTLYHFNTHNRYIVGLDPHYLYYYDADLYDLWLDITEGDEPDALNQIREQFKAQYIFSLKKEKDFLSGLKADPNLPPPVYEDDHALVYKL